MDPTPQQRATQILAQQLGVITRDRARRCGLSVHQVAYLLKTGMWVIAHPGIYRAAVVATSRNQRAFAALLHAPTGAVFSHFTAAQVHGLDVRPGSDLTWLTIPHTARRRSTTSVRFIRSRSVTEFSTTVAGRPVTTVARTLADLGEVLKPGRLRGVAYDALREKKATLAELTQAQRYRRRQGNALVEVLTGFDAAIESVLEEEADRALRAHGIHLHRQFRVEEAGRIIRRFDFAEPAFKVGVEIDGAAYHSSAAAQERDRTLDRRLAGLGWITLRFTTEDVRTRPEQMVETVRRVLAQRQGT